MSPAPIQIDYASISTINQKLDFFIKLEYNRSMKRKIRMIINRLKIWYIYYIKRQKTTVKGLYAAYYIADKYLLGNQVNIIEDYEYLIDSSARRLERMNLSTTCGRADAAFFALVNLVIFSSPAMKEQIYSYLKNYHYLSTLKKYVKAGIVI